MNGIEAARRYGITAARRAHHVAGEALRAAYPEAPGAIVRRVLKDGSAGNEAERIYREVFAREVAAIASESGPVDTAQ